MEVLAFSRGVELYQKEIAKAIRAAGHRLSILSDRALIETWGLYSCEIRNRFWVACNPSEISTFFTWADGKPAIGREIEKAQREILFRKEARAAARQVRPKARFIHAWDNHRIADPRIYSGDVRPIEPRRVPHEPLMTVHELTDSINRWCEEQGITPTSLGSKRTVDEQMVRYCCKYSLMDRPGSPSDGRSRGFSQKHACQLRTIRLLQARSLSMADINTILHGRSLPELREMEHEELGLLRATSPAREVEGLRPRTGSPRWA